MTREFLLQVLRAGRLGLAAAEDLRAGFLDETEQTHGVLLVRRAIKPARLPRRKHHRRGGAPDGRSERPDLRHMKGIPTLRFPKGRQAVRNTSGRIGVPHADARTGPDHSHRRARPCRGAGLQAPRHRGHRRPRRAEGLRGPGRHQPETRRDRARKGAGRRRPRPRLARAAQDGAGAALFHRGGDACGGRAARPRARRRADPRGGRRPARRVGISGDTSDNDEAAALAGITAAGLKADTGA